MFCRWVWGAGRGGGGACGPVEVVEAMCLLALVAHAATVYCTSMLQHDVNVLTRRHMLRQKSPPPLTCRTDASQVCPTVVLREVKHFEGTFAELRAAGAPGEGPAYADADMASQVFQASAPLGLKLFKLQKLVIH